MLRGDHPIYCADATAYVAMLAFCMEYMTRSYSVIPVTRLVKRYSEALPATSRTNEKEKP